jgi:hypothetical protein
LGSPGQVVDVVDEPVTAPVPGATVVVVVDGSAVAAPLDPEATVVVVVDGSDATVVDGSDAAAAVVDGDANAEAEAGAAVVSVGPVVWALTECRGRTVRAAMAPPVVTAVPRAATKALFLMCTGSGRSVRCRWAVPQIALRIRRQP